MGPNLKLDTSGITALLREPASLADTGLNPAFLYDLALKTIYFSGELTGQDVAANLRLPYANVVDQVLAFLIREELLTITGSRGIGERAYNHVVTQKGSNKALEILARSQYVGPAPVSLDCYAEVVHAQTIGEMLIRKADLKRALAHLVVPDSIVRRLGPAINSARSLFLYGPSGNGKTTLAEAISTLLTGTVQVPYGVLVDGQVIQVFDTLNHVPIEPDAEEQGGILGQEEIRPDLRWVECRRPFVVTGGELTLEALDLIFDPISKLYQAPYQMKANGGIFLIDDFGRQLVRPRDLLNRWIVPLEKRVDFLALQTGKKITVPFDILIIFSTNLNPIDLVDDAFLRRIRHKILVPNPTWDEFREIFKRVCEQRGVAYDDESFKYLVYEHYIKVKREPKSVHPRDLIDQIVDLAKYGEVEPSLTKELIDDAVDAYFIKM